VSNLAFTFGEQDETEDDLLDFAACPLEADPCGLRFYQQEAHDAIWDSWRENTSLLLLLPTGMGKTRVFSSVARRWVEEGRGRILVLAHTDELVEQAVRDLERYTGCNVGIEKAERTEAGEPIVVGSMQSVRAKKRLERFAKFTLVVVDEAHRSTCDSYQTIVRGIPQAKLLGVTATPDRGDGRALGEVFDDCAYLVDIGDGIDWGFLVGLDFAAVDTEIDVSDIQTNKKGDFVESALDKRMMGAVEGVVKAVLENYPDRKACCFFPGVRTAEYAAERFNALDPNSTAAVSGKTEKDLRRNIVRAAREGRLKRLTNCQVFTEGFDWPECDLIVTCRPTKSRALLAQMVGRGTRPLPGLVDSPWIQRGREGAEARRKAIATSAKPKLSVLDFTVNAGRHSLCLPEDVLGGTYTEAERQVARKKLKAAKPGEEVDVMAALRDARAELKAAAKKAELKVSYKIRKLDPFAVLGARRDDRADDTFGARPPTDPMLAALRKFRVEEKDLEGLTYRQAQRLLRACIGRAQTGQCSYRQARILAARGLPSDIPRERAAAVMNYLNAKGWGRTGEVDPEILRRMANGKPT
jgi:superfamily II DNA or RNA helicase